MEIKTSVKHKIKEKGQKQWEDERTGRRFYKIQRKMDGERSVAEQGEKRQECLHYAFSTQGLIAHFFKKGKHDFCQQAETVEHIGHCRRYKIERREIILIKMK